MADNWEQRKKVMELLGEGPTRRIHQTVVSVLALSGIALQGLVWWYAAQSAREVWGSAEMLFWTGVARAGVLTAGLRNTPVETSEGMTIEA